ncbi:MAG: 4Fe-4S binding protein [Deltaproteobacteria bacterium]|uniref:indolepyruvate ferredoxin oxidoreductase subunit alpha n=1 Tax=Desulfobacula sp. TaxID=2593537 RepID=UPI00198B067B|nr:4Fe-4S binding protein [Candidatus Desulfobacula maris]MBL6994296.1 4Fe-4S binding protein [Desulfobacula sp.]
MEDVYKKLAIHLDNTPSGFPETESGVELRILKQLFTTQEAELALCLVLMPEPVEAIAQRAGKEPSEIEPVLIEMGKKGLIIHINRNGINTFMFLQFVVGIWEYQVNRLTKELIRDFNEYVPFLIKDQYKNKTQQLRVVPVAKSVNTELNIMDYEQVESIIKSQSKILVAPCICRKEHTIMEKGCDKISEACLIFGGGAYIYENRGIGRTISQEEALDIVKEAEKQGLVAQPSNAKKPMNICLCCECCCQILKNIKNFEAPAKIVSSNFQTNVDIDECTGCFACRQICPMDAIDTDEGETVAMVNMDRCIGCGLCVTVCEFDAMSLKDKAETEKIEPPANLVETYMNIAKEKGLF